jgi:hypothetical protein
MISIPTSRRIVFYLPVWGVSRLGAFVYRSSGYEFVTAAALVLGIVVSWGAKYGLNRLLGTIDDPYETAGTARIFHPSD